MKVIFSKKCELAIQSILYISTFANNTIVSAEDISSNLNQPKEFISKILQSMTKSDIVGSKKGKEGGFYLKKDPSTIRLIDIVREIDGLDVFNHCVLGFEGCSSDNPCPVHDKWGKLRNEAYTMLSEETLADLKSKTKDKIKNIKK